MTNTKFAVVTKSVGAVLLASLVIEASVYFVRWCTRIALRHVQGTRSGAKSEGDGKHELLFFPDDRPACKAHYTERQGCHDPRCRFSHEDTSFTKLMRRLNSARVSVDLCVFCFTSPELAEAVTALYGRGVKVRVITDNEQVDAANSQVGRFRAHGTCDCIELLVIASNFQLAAKKTLDLYLYFYQIRFKLYSP